MLKDQLHVFQLNNNVFSKGALSVVLVITRNSKQLGFPLKEEYFVTGKEGQVKGLGKAAVQGILNEYGIQKILAEEGGRTSRGSMGLMKKYIAFLNGLYPKIDLDEIERFWVEQIKTFFAGKPFRLNVDKAKSISNAIKAVLKQAESRQKETTGTMYVGAIYQHLVGAKLRIALKRDDIDCYGFSVADETNGRRGDFEIEDSVIHVTVTPQEALVRKCELNIENSLRPIIITSENGYVIAKSLLETMGLSERVEVYEISQFISINVNELGNFRADEAKNSLEEIVEEYNRIIKACETDPSLLITII